MKMLLTSAVSASIKMNTSHRDILNHFDFRIKQLKFYQAYCLAIWALVNILSGIMVFFSKGFLYYVCAMNCSWGIINGAIAVFIYYHHNDELKTPQPVLKQMDHQRHAEKIILLNVGLDIAFIATGVTLFFYGDGMNTTYPQLWRGFGFSVIMQGVFLLIQDIIFYSLHRNNLNKVYPVWKTLLDNI